MKKCNCHECGKELIRLEPFVNGVYEFWCDDCNIDIVITKNEDLDMKKIYRVVIHYEGAVAFEVKADNTTEAEQLAEELFNNMSDRELVENLGEIGVCDCYEVN